jgi:hypothetical protein
MKLCSTYLDQTKKEQQVPSFPMLAIRNKI